MRKLRILHLTLIVLAGIVTYSNTLHVPFVLDDFSTITFYGPQHILDILLNGSTRRVVDVTFAINYKIHGLGLPGYHLVNLTIHISVAVVIYFIVSSIISALHELYSSQDGCQERANLADKFVPFAVAMLFVCHPLQTQAVTYIIQRYTSLATFFYLLSVLFFLRARLNYKSHGRGVYPWFFGGLALAAAILSMGSKQIAVTLPVMLILLELLIFKGQIFDRKCIVVCMTLCILALASALFMWRVGSFHEFISAVNAATSEDPRIPRLTYFFTQSRVVASYLRLLLLPLGQSVVHESPIYTTLFSSPVIAALSLHVSLFAVSLALLRQSRQNFLSKKWERGMLQRLACLGIVWFYCAMAVESSFFPIRDVMFEQRVYLPSVGFCMVIISFTALAACTLRAGKRILWVILTVVCIVLGGMTIARNQVWNTRLLLWQDAVRKYPDNALALSNLGGEYLVLKMPEKTVPLYVRTMELGGEFQAFNLGVAMKALNIFGYRFTTGMEFMRPGGPLGSGEIAAGDEIKYKSVVFNTLALAYEYLGETDKALRSYRRSIKADPSYDLAWYNLGLLLNQLGERSEAAGALAELRKLNPELARSLASVVAI